MLLEVAFGIGRIFGPGLFTIQLVPASFAKSSCQALDKPQLIPLINK